MTVIGDAAAAVNGMEASATIKARVRAMLRNKGLNIIIVVPAFRTNVLIMIITINEN